jgi:glutathione S-transferase
LFFEFHGSENETREQSDLMQQISNEHGGSAIQWASAPEERSKLWKARHHAYYSVLALKPGHQAFATDACVPISRLADCLLETRADVEREGMLAPIVGHVGDGNFHLTLLFNPQDPADRARAEGIARRVSARAIGMGGTCTGEHGVGSHKLDALIEEHGPAVDLMRRVKRALDPYDIMNPGKTVPLEAKDCAMYTLYVANKTYSSWSLRAWLVMKLTGAPFRVVNVPLGEAPSARGFSPSGLVPVLHDDATVVWDTFAIAEYLAERHPGLWPADPFARAWARSISAEMHAGFAALRSEMAMCVRERVDVRPWSAALTAAIARVEALWHQSRQRFGAGGEYLCGAFSIADAFYAPVAFRFRTYAVAPQGAAGAYLATMLAHPWLQAWEQDALAETTRIDYDEPRVIYRDKLAAAHR